jgi:hypothetical protein
MRLARRLLHQGRMQVQEHHEVAPGLMDANRRQTMEHQSGEHEEEEVVARDMVDTPVDQPWAHTLGLLMVAMVLGLVALTAILYFML